MNAIPKRLAGGALLLSVLLVCAQAPAASLTLNPVGGALFGTPGATVGWGFTLTNDTGYLVITGTDFSLPLGTFSDLIGPFSSHQSIVLGPGDTFSQAFSAASQTGLGEFAIDPSTFCGQVATGSITLTYDLYSVSPNDSAFDPDQDLISVGNILTADASVSVVPEPGSLLLMASAMPALVAWRRRAQRWDRAAANG